MRKLKDTRIPHHLAIHDTLKKPEKIQLCNDYNYEKNCPGFRILHPLHFIFLRVVV